MRRRKESAVKIMSEIVFNNKISVHRWLLDNGWTIGKSQFYDHCKEGLLRPAKKDGKYHLAAVKKYAALHVVVTETGKKETEWESKIREEKLEVALRREQVGLERERFDLQAKQGKLIPRSEFELALVARAVAFMAHLNHTVQQEVPDWIELVEGNQGRAAELVEAISRAIEQRMADFAVDAEFEILLEANQ